MRGQYFSSQPVTGELTPLLLKKDPKQFFPEIEISSNLLDALVSFKTSVLEETSAVFVASAFLSLALTISEKVN